MSISISISIGIGIGSSSSGSSSSSTDHHEGGKGVEPWDAVQNVCIFVYSIYKYLYI